MRNEYQITGFFNDRFYSKVVVDQHYKVSHPEITDELILNLIRSIDLNVDSESTDGYFDYYKVDPLYFLGDPYRLILVIEKDADYLGVINAFRVRRANGISKSKRD